MFSYFRSFFIGSPRKNSTKVDLNIFYGDFPQIVEAYKHYMVDVSQLLGGTSIDASTFSEDIYHYEKRIAEITPVGQQENPFISHRRLTLSKMKEIAGKVLQNVIVDRVGSTYIFLNFLLCLPVGMEGGENVFVNIIISDLDMGILKRL